MKGRTLAVLAAIVALLAAFVWFVERDLPGSDERAELAKRVLDFDGDEVDAVEWSADGESLRLERGDAGWRLTAPLDTRADTGLADGWVEQLTTLEKQRTLEGTSAAAVGLAPPAATVSIEVDGEDRLLLVGGRLPASDLRVVAASEAGPFWVVEDTLDESMMRAVDDWRSRDLWPGSAAEVERLTLTTADSELELARREGDFWLEAPIEDRADPGTVRRLLDRLAGAQVERFVAASESQVAALESPEAVVTIEQKSGEIWTLEIGPSVSEPPVGDPEASNPETSDAEVMPADGDAGVAPSSVRLARAENSVLTVDDPLAEAWTLAVDEWRSLELATLEVFEIDRVTAIDEAGTVILDRVDGQWSRDGEAIAATTVSDLLYALTGAKAVAVDAPDSSVDPLLTLTLGGSAGDERLEILPAIDDRHPARTSGRTALVWVEGAVYRDLRSKLLEVRAAPVEGAAVEPQADAPTAPEGG